MISSANSSAETSIASWTQTGSLNTASTDCGCDEEDVDAEEEEEEEEEDEEEEEEEEEEDDDDAEKCCIRTGPRFDSGGEPNSEGSNVVDESLVLFLFSETSNN